MKWIKNIVNKVFGTHWGYTQKEVVEVEHRPPIEPTSEVEKDRIVTERKKKLP